MRSLGAWSHAVAVAVEPADGGGKVGGGSCDASNYSVTRFKTETSGVSMASLGA